jgi:hypothetical protein
MRDPKNLGQPTRDYVRPRHHVLAYTKLRKHRRMQATQTSPPQFMQFRATPGQPAPPHAGPRQLTQAHTSPDQRRTGSAHKRPRHPTPAQANPHHLTSPQASQCQTRSLCPAHPRKLSPAEDPLPKARPYEKPTTIFPTKASALCPV